MKKLLQSKKRGSAIPLAVVALLILLAVGVGLLSLGFNSRVYSIHMASDIAARCAADAGLTNALFEMNQKLQVKPWNDSTLPQAMNVSLPYSDAVCSYWVGGNLAGGYVIMSLGRSGRANRMVRAAIGLESAFNHAILTKQTLTLKSGTVVDGYNSLAADPFGADVEVGIGSQSASDSSVVLNMGSTVEGDVFVAGNVDSAIKDLGSTVSGDKFASSPQPLRRVTAPALPDRGAISAAGQTVKITPANSGTYSSIDLQQLSVVEEKKVIDTLPAVLVVEGGDVVLHVTGDIELGNSCEIVVTDNSTLTIYTDGNIHCRNGSGINTEAPPEEAETLQIYATGTGDQYFDIKAKSEFTGIIYAPDADVDLYAKGNAYGAIVARDFEYKAGGNFYYDAALRDKNTVKDEGVQFVVTRWYESAPHFSTWNSKVIAAEPVAIEPVK
ncbi:MAG: hypothetical protein JSW66_17295 [Phycisphaerales bacterium]|nr:MAG: hypothetical protein JSW66_17295 [Phycisphaerales bacterium]